MAQKQILKTVLAAIVFACLFCFAKGSLSVYPVAGFRKFLLPKFLFGIFIFFAGLTFTSPAYGANIYVDKNANCTGNYSITNRNCTGSDGNSYTTIQVAVNAMNGGDHIFIRGGVYNEKVAISQGGSKDGTENNYSSMESYQGEWAVIDGTGTSATGEYLIGGHCNRDDSGGNHTRYWRFERLEIRNYHTHGISINAGPIIIKYCYIHTPNSNTNDGGNPAAIWGHYLHDSVIKYNIFDDNGEYSWNDELRRHSNDIMPASDYVSTDGNFNRETNYWNPTYHAYNNEIAYNYFPNTTGRSSNAYRMKAQQCLAAKTTVDFENRGNLGDKFHHNIVKNQGIMGEQDFLQIYNNIVDGGNISATLADPGYTTGMTGVCVYNNTINGGRIAASFGNGGSNVPTPYMWWYNNVISQGVDSSIFDQISMHGRNGNAINESRIVTDRNYIYRGDDNYDFLYMDYTNGIVDRERHMTTDTYNSTYNRSNYSKASSEGTDNLYSSTYITRGDHSLGQSGETIANGGIGGNHPYLSGVTIPSYIGATNPNDNAWVAGVLSLGTLSSGTPTTLVSATAGEDPDWIEDSAPTSDDITSPIAPTGLSVS